METASKVKVDSRERSRGGREETVVEREGTGWEEAGGERVERESDDVSSSSWREGRTKSGKDFTIDCSCEARVKRVFALYVS